MIRCYKDQDYDRIKELYQHSEWYGGQFDEARDGRERLAAKISDDPDSILVFEDAGAVLGTVSLIEDGRVAWLFRFAVVDNDLDVSQALYARAVEILRTRGHEQILVYTPAAGKHSAQLDARYKALGMNRGAAYTCFWAETE